MASNESMEDIQRTQTDHRLKLVQFWGIKEGSRVLEIGCGQGDTTAILGLGRVVKKPIVQDDEIIIAKVLPLSLSYDHRTIDGASGARFLNVLKELLSDPDLLLLKS